MTRAEKEMWQISIENAVSAVCSLCNPDAADGIFERYNATDFDNLSPYYYAAVLGDLELIAYRN